jgi:hypothetical protein
LSYGLREKEPKGRTAEIRITYWSIFYWKWCTKVPNATDQRAWGILQVLLPAADPIHLSTPLFFILILQNLIFIFFNFYVETPGNRRDNSPSRTMTPLFECTQLFHLQSGHVDHSCRISLHFPAYGPTCRVKLQLTRSDSSLSVWLFLAMEDISKHASWIRLHHKDHELRSMLEHQIPPAMHSIQLWWHIARESWVNH